MCCTGLMGDGAGAAGMVLLTSGFLMFWVFLSVLLLFCAVYVEPPANPAHDRTQRFLFRHAFSLTCIANLTAPFRSPQLAFRLGLGLGCLAQVA